MTELLVGTKKGLFVLEGDPDTGSPFAVATRAFPGDVVEFAVRDPRTGRYLAGVTSGFYGPRIFYTDDPAGEWEQADGPAFPEGSEASVERVWVIQPGEADGLLYAGVDPAALFDSTDGGASWTLNEALWKEHQAGDWQPGFGGLALHSICPWPGDPQRLAIGVSAAGVWITEDGGQTWRTGYRGMVPVYVPEEAREDTNVLCVHNMHRAPLATRTTVHAVPRQRVSKRRCGVNSWNDIAAGLPERVRVPAGARPRRPRQRLRDPVDGGSRPRHARSVVRVYQTRDGGRDLAGARRRTARPRGLPNGLPPGLRPRGRRRTMGLYFGATSGDVFGSADAGAHWFTVHERLAPVTSVRVA